MQMTLPLWQSGFPCDSAGKESAYNMGDLDLIPGWGRSPGEGKGQYSGLENSMVCIIHGVARSRTQLSDFHFHFMAENKEELKSILMKVKEESGKKMA